VPDPESPDEAEGAVDVDGLAWAFDGPGSQDPGDDAPVGDADDGTDAGGQIDDDWSGDDWSGDDWSGDDGDYVYVPEEPGLFRRFATVGVVLAVLAVLVLGAGLVWMRDRLEPSGPKEAVVLTIPADVTTAQIAGLLEDEGVISDATIFRYYVKWQNAGPFQAGNYDGLTTNQAMGAVVDRLEAGPLPPATTQIIIPEGLWVADVKARMLEAFPEMDEGELDAVLVTARSRYQPDVPVPGTRAPLEGLLFPAGYEVGDADRGDEAKLIQQMLDTFDRTADEVGIGDAPTRLAGQAGSVVISPYDAIIVASLIEEEAGTEADKPKIARVVYNRLLRGMTLGIDATVIYAIGVHTETLTRSDLAIDSPFNTRVVAGLPPSPIAAPSRSSLEAALNPSTEEGSSQWLYYVLADAEGNHFFTGNYDDFLNKAEEGRRQGLFE